MVDDPNKDKDATPSASPEEESELSTLRKNLYKQDEPAEFKARISSLKTDKPKVRKKPVEDTDPPEFVDVIKKRSRKRKVLTLWIVVGALALLAFAVAVWATFAYRNSLQVKDEQIQLTIDAPQEFVAGEDAVYTLRYGNDSRVDWSGAEIVFTPPQGFLYRSSDREVSAQGQQYFIPVGDLSQGQKGEVAFTGQLLGEQQSTALAQAEIAFHPANAEKARMTKSQTANTLIVAVPIDVSITAGNNAAEGERVVAQVTVRNTSSVPLSGMRLQIEPAFGLELMTGDTTFSADFSVPDTAWELPEIAPREEITRTVVMRVSGRPGERRVLTARGVIVGGENQFVLRTVEHVITVSSAELMVHQEFNGQGEDLVVRAEDNVEARVVFKNVGTVGLKNVIVRVTLGGFGLDPASLKLPAGAYDPIQKTITWTAASVPQLATLLPGQEGELFYTFDVLPTDQFPVNEETINPSITAVATVDSPDLPTPSGQERRVITDQFTMPVATNLTLDADAFYDDGRLGITSTGPLPPEVGQRTTYTMRFRLGSTLNAAGEIHMIARLPEGIEYTDETYMTTGEVEFNDRTREVDWLIPQIDAQAGRSGPAPELHIQVAITPGENLRGEVMPFLQSAVASGLDLYAEEQVEVRLQTVPTTRTADRDNGTVQ